MEGLGFNPALVDDYLNEVIDEIQAEDPVLLELKGSPRHQLAFRTFAWLKAGILLGQLLMERDVDETESAEWVRELVADPDVRTRLAAEVESVGYQIACEPSMVHESARRPDPAMRRRFMRLADSLLSQPAAQP